MLRKFFASLFFIIFLGFAPLFATSWSISTSLADQSQYQEQIVDVFYRFFEENLISSFENTRALADLDFDGQVLVSEVLDRDELEVFVNDLIEQLKFNRVDQEGVFTLGVDFEYVRGLTSEFAEKLADQADVEEEVLQLSLENTIYTNFPPEFTIDVQFADSIDQSPVGMATEIFKQLNIYLAIISVLLLLAVVVLAWSSLFSVASWLAGAFVLLAAFVYAIYSAFTGIALESDIFTAVEIPGQFTPLFLDTIIVLQRVAFEPLKMIAIISAFVAIVMIILAIVFKRRSL